MDIESSVAIAIAMLESQQANRVSSSSDRLPESPSLLDEAIVLSRDLGGLLHDHVELLVLEVRSAASGFVAMVGAGVAIAILLVTTWLALMGAASFALVGLGTAPALALVMVGAFNLAAAAVAFAFLRSRTRTLALPATLRLLSPAPGAPHQAPK